MNYTVSYRALTECPAKAGNVATTENNFTLSGLNSYTNYSITVFASTVKGNGNVSAPINISTDQDGKCSLLGDFRYMVSSEKLCMKYFIY